MPATNFRDTVGAALQRSKTAMVERLRAKMGPPPASVAGPAQKDDEYRAFWKLADGWDDPAVAQQKAAALYAAGAKIEDVAAVMYPDRMTVISAGDRYDDLEKQAKFCDDMVARHFEVLAGTVGEQMKVLQKVVPSG